MFEPPERAVQLRSSPLLMINERGTPSTSPAGGRPRPQPARRHISSSDPEAPTAVITQSRKPTLNAIRIKI